MAFFVRTRPTHRGERRQKRQQPTPPTHETLSTEKEIIEDLSNHDKLRTRLIRGLKIEAQLQEIARKSAAHGWRSRT